MVLAENKRQEIGIMLEVMYMYNVHTVHVLYFPLPLLFLFPSDRLISASYNSFSSALPSLPFSSLSDSPYPLSQLPSLPLSPPSLSPFFPQELQSRMPTDISDMRRIVDEVQDASHWFSGGSLEMKVT